MRKSQKIGTPNARCFRRFDIDATTRNGSSGEEIAIQLQKTEEEKKVKITECCKLVDGEEYNESADESGNLINEILGSSTRWERSRRLENIQRGIERGNPLLEDPHDRRIFKTPKPIDNFLPIALKHLTVSELVEAVKPRYYGNIRYKPAGDYIPPNEVPEVARCSEPAPSTAAPAAADTSSEEEEEEEEALQITISEKEKAELTGVAAVIAKSSAAAKSEEDIEAAIARATIPGRPPPPSSRPLGRGRGVRALEAPPSARRFAQRVFPEDTH